MNDESDDDKCNCIDCYVQPTRSFKVKEGKKETPNAPKIAEFQGMKRGFFNPKKPEDAAASKRAAEIPPSITVPIPTAPRETTAANQKLLHIPMPETIECEKVVLPEIQQQEEKADLKCNMCIETNDMIDIHNQAAFRVTCTGGCMLILHRNCFEKALGSAKKKELKTCICPTDDCGCSVLEITHRIPGRYHDFAMWLRCEVKESERPKKEEKGKEVKKKDEKKDKEKHKKDRREEHEGRRVGVAVGVEENCTGSSQSNPLPSCPETTPFISLALPIKPRDEEAKKNLVKPLPADLEARPIERKEDAVMSKYAVKETATKENRKKNKKEVKQVVLPGLKVKGQRGKTDEEDPWNTNDAPSQMEEVEGNSGSAVGTGMENNTDTRYEEGRYGFAMPEEVHNHGMQLGEGEWMGGGMREMMPSNMEMNYPSNPFYHPLPVGHGGVFRPIPRNEAAFPAFPSLPLHEQNGHESLSGFTESPAMDEPPLIENTYDYPTLASEAVRKRKDLVNFFETHTPVLEENAALFESQQIDLDQLMNMLENFIELQFYGNEEEKRNMADTLHSIFTGEVENDIIPFLIDLHCFKYGYVDGRLVVSVKTEGIQRREREEQLRREREEEERRVKEEERRREEKKKEEVKKAVMEIEERRRREMETRERAIREEEERQRKRKEEEERRARETRRKEEEERRQALIEEREREREREKEKENQRRLEEEERNKRMEEMEKKEKEKMLENEKIRLEEEGRKKRMEEMEKKEKDKRALQKELERKTREAINTLRSHRQSKSSSSDSSPERKQLLKHSRSTGSSSSSLAPFPPSSASSTAFSTTAPPFVPRSSSTNLKPELNPNAPAFVPIQPVEVPILTDENGDEVDKLWIAANKLKHDKSVSTIEELNRRIAQLEAEKREMEDQTKAKEMEMMKKDGTRMTQERMNKEMIAQLESQVKGYNEQVVWKDRKISQITLESEKKSDELNHVRTSLGSKLEEMKTRIREEKLIASSERREKESVMEMREREEEEKRRALMERKTACAKDAILVCTHIINKLATDPEAQVMASIFIDLRHKWTAHHAVLDQRLSAYKAGQPIDLAAALALKEPSMPRETDDLVQECYVWHYQTMHVLSFRLAGIVKKCLNEQKRYYEDAYIIGIIQKWMRMFKDPTKIEATVPQVANMVTQAMGDPPLMPPKYVHVNAPIPSLVSMPPLHSEGMRTTQRATQRAQPCDMNEPKGWKKASEKMRVVALENGYECAICLDEMDGDDISYCEQVSCNEPYHNTCLDEYWKTGGRFCPRCRTPMPPRDAFPALG